MRLLLFRLQSAATFAIPAAGAVVNEELLTRLSHDFLDVDTRAGEAAKKAVSDADLKFKSRQVWIPVVGAVGTVIAGLLALSLTLYGGIADLKAQVAKMDGRLGALPAQPELKQLEERIRTLETRPRGTPPRDAAPPQDTQQ